MHDRPTTSGDAAFSEPTFRVATPRISLPSGERAIRGIGEKFGANPVTGAASMTIPIFASPGWSGFGPGLAPEGLRAKAAVSVSCSSFLGSYSRKV